MAGGVRSWDLATNTTASMGAGLNGVVNALVTLPNGNVVAAVEQLPTWAHLSDILVWDGTSWTPLATGIATATTTTPVTALHVLPNGDLLIGGTFSSINGVLADNVAVWDGAAWSEFAGGVDGLVSKFGELANGSLVVGGRFTHAGSVPAANIATYDGASWSPLGSGLAQGVFLSSAVVVNGLVTMPNGDLVATGFFQFADGLPANNVARWDGSSWHAMGAGIGGASFYSGVQSSAALLPSGEVVVGGSSASGGVYTGLLQRWDGTSWSSMAAFTGSFVRSLATTPNGELIVGGSFTQVDGINTANAVRLTTSCPASVVPYGAACSGSGGNNELVADTLPWTGSTFKATGSGLAPLSLLAVDAGFAPLGPLSLASLGVPAAGPGCMLHVDPVYFEFGFTTQGSYTWNWEIANDPVFAGIGVHLQFVVFEVDPALSLIETTSTNALELTLGSF